MAISEDASAPPEVVDGTGSASVSTASFTPPDNSMVVIMINGGYTDAAGHPVVTVSDSSGGGAWVDVVQDGSPQQWNGMSAVAAKFFASSPGAITVTATFDVTTYGIQVVTKVLLGASPTVGAGVATAITVPSFDFVVTITPEATGSMIYGASDCDNDNTSMSWTPIDGGTTEIEENVDSVNLCTMVAWRSTGPTASTSPITLGESVPTNSGGGSAAALEIKEAGGTPEPFDPPGNVAAAATSGSEITVTWDAVATATGYDVERDGAVIATNVQGTSYDDAGLTAGTQYDYRVRSRRSP